MEREGGMNAFEHAQVRLAGNSIPIRDVGEDIDLAGSSDSNVIVNSELSAVRDVVARLIHRRNAVRCGPLTTLDCSGLSDGTLASWWAGVLSASHLRPECGQPELIDRAPKATLFLDNIECASPPVQDELFQCIEACSEASEPGVRVIAGTGGNLLPRVTAGTFREDLYYRLNVILICIPPRGESYEDLPMLLEHLLQPRASKDRR
jgi:DNA-binding NtrC family response regulator